MNVKRLLYKEVRNKQNMIRDYVALDLETTGLNPSNDRIIEIGMAKIEDGNITDRYQSFVNPMCHIDDRIHKLTGIDDSMVSDAPVINDIIVDIIEFIGELPILGHNIIFDYSFLKKAAVNNNITFEKEGIDTLKLARRLLLNVEHKRLEDLCECFHINPGNSHRAFDDAISASCLYNELYKIKPDDEGFEKTQKLIYSVKKDSPITPAQKSYLTSLVNYYNIKLEEQIDGLTKSRASKIIDGIISEYGKMPYKREHKTNTHQLKYN